MKLKNNNSVEGISINFREAETSDAEFILSLRLDSDLNKHICKVDNDIEKQKNYITICKEDLSQIYFIIENKNHEPLGTIRIHDYTEKTFTLGSLVVRKDASRKIPIESIFLALFYGYVNLKLKTAIFNVKKANNKVAGFYKKLGANVFKEDEDSYYYEYTIKDYNLQMNKFYKFMKHIQIQENDF